MKVLEAKADEFFVVQIEHRTANGEWFNVADYDSQSEAFDAMRVFEPRDPDRTWRVVRMVKTTIITEIES